jgi:hypothetical protein
VTHAYNPSYLLEDGFSRPVQKNSSRDPISKTTRAKWTADVVEEVERLLCKHEAPSSNPSSIKTKQKKGYMA